MVANPHGSCKNAEFYLGTPTALPPPDIPRERPSYRQANESQEDPTLRITVLSLIAAAALTAPIAAFAGSAPTTSSAANDFCKQQQTTLGTSFAAAYKNFGQCVSANTKNALNAIANASKACSAERTANPAAFKAKNAFGKCVAAKVSQAAKAAATKAPSALSQCKAARKSDATGFAAKWGSGADALGKCVAATAKA
jgi:hypothetical protein